MAPPIYFFPTTRIEQLHNGAELSREVLHAHGLDRTLADVAWEDCATSEIVGRGPGGSSGSTLQAQPVDGKTPIRVGYSPEFQDWTQFSSGLWVGIDREFPPTPGDLARKQQFGGYLIELAGCEWKIPVVRDPEGGTGLPRDWDLGDNGSVTEKIKKEYVRYWEEFASVVDLFFDPDRPYSEDILVMDRSEALAHSLDAIRLNYRVGRHEQNLLHLVDAENWTAILSRTVDLPTFWAVYQDVQVKKKARHDQENPDESTGTTPGPPADAPDTAPAAPSCSCSASATDAGKSQ